MNGKTHVTVGIGTASIIAVTYWPTIHIAQNLVYPGIGIITAGIGAKVADVDLQGSEMGNKYPILAKIFTHRGMTHTLVFPAGVAFLLMTVCAIPQTVSTSFLASLIFGFLVGYLSHIFADDHNLKGTQTFWPLCREHLHVMSIATGTVQETIYCIGFVTLCVGQILFTLMGWTI